MAVQSEDRSLSYSELRDNVTYLSSLIKSNGIYRTSIAICVPKDICHIVAILATIDSNNVFVPIDYKLPLKRIKMQFLEANIQFAIVNNETKDIIKNIDKNIIQINIDTYKINKKKFIINNKFDDLTSYIFFTSGSTGKPKAILGSYKGLWSFLEWEIKEFKVNSSYNISFISAIGFDPMLRDIFLPLLVGGTLFIPTMDELLDINKFINWIKSNNINLIHIVPTLFKYLFNSCSVDDLVNLKYILLAGELLRGKDIEFFYKKHLDSNTKLINLYGPSESILAKFYHYITYDDLNSNFIPVGKPISHVKYKLIDSNGHTISDNSRGEIIIMPNFKLLGYYNNPEKNKEAFTKKFSFSKYYNS
ncbi:MAG: AMP-binding protein, partial [bacterium]|nr:AMP-binding protein [bacterium]